MRRIPFIVLFAILLSVSYGQENRSLFPDGFHIGVTGEGNLAQRMTVVAIGQNWPAPLSDPTLGWQAGRIYAHRTCKRAHCF